MLLTEEDIKRQRKKTRVTMSGGLEDQEYFSNDGVNRMLLLLITPRVKEDYEAFEVREKKSYKRGKKMKKIKKKKKKKE